MWKKAVLCMSFALASMPSFAGSAESQKQAHANEMIMSGIYAIGWAQKSIDEALAKEGVSDSELCFDLARMTTGTAALIGIHLREATHLPKEIRSLESEIFERNAAIEGFCRKSERTYPFKVTKAVAFGDIVGLKAEVATYNEMLTRIFKSAIAANAEMRKRQ